LSFVMLACSSLLTVANKEKSLGSRSGNYGRGSQEIMS
jgi:hypothetical protein